MKQKTTYYRKKDKLAKWRHRTDIGYCIDLVFTQGGFVKTGQTIMDIVPEDHQLVIEARGSHLIDKVTPPSR